MANAHGWRRFGIEIGVGIALDVDTDPDPDCDFESDTGGQARLPINKSVQA